jgi:hypothetical protein
MPPSYLVLAQETGDVLETHFGLADNVYAEAIVKPIGTVCLWLGVRPYPSARTLLLTQWLPRARWRALCTPPIPLSAFAGREPALTGHCALPDVHARTQANVMLEYSYEEAKEVLSTNMAGAERKIVRGFQLKLDTRTHRQTHSHLHRPL